MYVCKYVCTPSIGRVSPGSMERDLLQLLLLLGYQ